MTPEFLIANFERLADAPDATQKLRGLILDLAVSGRLTTGQDDGDTAGTLLKEIAPDVENIRSQLKTRKRSGSNELVTLHFELPGNWEWCRISDLGAVIRGVTYPKSESQNIPGSNFSPILRANNIRDELEFHDLVYIPDSRIKEHQRLQGQDIVVALSSGSADLVGKAGILKTEFAGSVGAFCGIIRLSSQLNRNYAAVFFASPAYRVWVSRLGRGIGINNLGVGQLDELAFPLPPLAEQARIVAKVDELMAKCDELEKRQEAARETRIRVHKASLNSLVEATTPDELSTAWQRLSDNFYSLVDSAESLVALRECCLRLAFSGRFTNLNLCSKSETADLLNSLADYRDSRSEGSSPKYWRSHKSIEMMEDINPLPKSWRWISLGQISALITKGSSPKWQGVSYTNNAEDLLFVTSENVRNMHMDLSSPKFVEKKFNEIEPRSVLRQDDVLLNIVGASIGRAAVFTDPRNANINQAVCLIRPIRPHDLILPRYIAHYLNSPMCRELMFEKQVDNARANLSMGNIARFPIPITDLQNQQNVIDLLDKLFLLLERLQEDLNKVAALRENFCRAAVKSSAAA